MEPSRATHYRAGEPILAGDRVSWAGLPGRVLFVLETSVPEDREAEAEWFAAEFGEGFLLDVEGVGLVFEEGNNNEDLDLIGRASPLQSP